MRVLVFCSATDVAPAYHAAAAELGALIGERKHSLVWGGSDRGTMKTVADAAQAAGSRIVGVSVEPIKDQARTNADEMIIAKSWPERRATMLARSDALVVLPGGLGTLDEVTEVLEYKKHNMHHKRVVFLNIAGFYDGMKEQLQRMERDGFLPGALSDFVSFAETPREAMNFVDV